MWIVALSGCVTGMMVLGPVCGLMLASVMLRLPQNLASDGMRAAYTIPITCALLRCEDCCRLTGPAPEIVTA